VRESLAEREKLLHIAPHLVNPLRFVVPIYERSKRGPGMIRLGMIGYDVLSFDKSVPNHKMLSREEALERTPASTPTASWAPPPTTTGRSSTPRGSPSRTPSQPASTARRCSPTRR
jgi:hypothetical protein